MAAQHENNMLHLQSLPPLSIQANPSTPRHAPNTHSVTAIDLDTHDTESQTSANSISRASSHGSNENGGGLPGRGGNGGSDGAHGQQHKAMLNSSKDFIAKPKFSLTFQNIPEEAEVSSAERKSVSLSDTSHSRYTLFFTRWELESDFRKALASTLHSSKRVWALALTLFLIAVVVKDAWEYDQSTKSDGSDYNESGSSSNMWFGEGVNAYGHKLIWGSIGWLMMLLICIATAIPACAHRFPQLLLSLSFIVAGCFLIFECTLINDVIGQLNDCVIILAFLVMYHTLARLYLFPYIVVSSWLVALIYTSLAWSMRWSGESVVHTLSETVYVMLCNSTLCYASYMHESYKRRMFIANQEILHESRKLKKETHDLRGEIWEMVMEKYNINDAASRKTIDLTSPVEKAMDILKALQSDGDLPHKFQSQVLEVIKHIGSSSEIFKPSIDQVLNNTVLDTNTTRWLASLVNNDDGGQNKRKKRVRSPESVAHDAILSITNRNGIDSLLFPQGSSFVQTLTSQDEELYARIQTNFEDWSMDVFDIAKLTSGHPLFFVGISVFRRFEWLSKLNIDVHKLFNFFTAIEQGYHANKPYHNNIHAADVTRTVYYFLSVTNMKAYLSDLEMLAAVVAAAVHDLDHPGVSNAFLVRQRDQKAVLYNDKSVLENHHCAHAFKLLLKPENNFLAALPRKDFDYIRRLVIEMVLATDLGHHFELITHFKTLSLSGQIDRHIEASKIVILKMGLKCGDVGHAAKKLPLHLKWTERVVEEFYQQGDVERKSNIPISPFMDRQKSNVPKAQQGFIDFLVMPMFDSWAKFLCEYNTSTSLPPPAASSNNALMSPTNPSASTTTTTATATATATASSSTASAGHSGHSGGEHKHKNSADGVRGRDGPSESNSSTAPLSSSFSSSLTSSNSNVVINIGEARGNGDERNAVVVFTGPEHMPCVIELKANREHWFNLLEASEKEALLGNNSSNAPSTSSTPATHSLISSTSFSDLKTQNNDHHDKKEGGFAHSSSSPSASIGTGLTTVFSSLTPSSAAGSINTTNNAAAIGPVISTSSGGVTPPLWQSFEATTPTPTPTPTPMSFSTHEILSKDSTSTSTSTSSPLSPSVPSRTQSASLPLASDTGPPLRAQRESAGSTSSASPPLISGPPASPRHRHQQPPVVKKQGSAEGGVIHSLHGGTGGMEFTISSAPHGHSHSQQQPQVGTGTHAQYPPSLSLSLSPQHHVITSSSESSQTLPQSISSAVGSGYDNVSSQHTHNPDQSRVEANQSDSQPRSGALSRLHVAHPAPSLSPF